MTHAYLPEYWVAPLLTFDSKARVVYVVSRKDRNPEFERAILRAKRFAVVVRPGGAARRMAATLASLGARPQRQEVAGWSVFWDIAPPPEVPRALPASQWSLSAQPAPGLAFGAVDYNAVVGWLTPGGQHPGQWLQVDLGQVRPDVCSLMLYNGMAENGPHDLALSGSQDGRNWERLAQVEGLPVPFAWTANSLVALRWNNWQEFRFAPRPLRYLRLEQTGKRPNWKWSVLEMSIGVTQGTRPRPQQAAAWLRQRLAGQGVLWCGPGLAAWLPADMRPQGIRQARPAWLPRFLREEWVLPSDGPLNFAMEAGRAPYAQAALKAAGWRFQREEKHGYVWLAATPPKREATPAVSQDITLRAGPDGLVGELPRAGIIRGLELLPTGGDALTWAGLKLELALAQGEFAPVAVQGRWPARMFWSGLLPMAARPGPARLILPPTQAQRLRLSRAGAPLPPEPRVRVYLQKD